MITVLAVVANIIARIVHSHPLVFLVLSGAQKQLDSAMMFSVPADD